MKMTETQNSLLKIDLEKHVEEYKANLMQMNFFQDKNESGMKNILQKTENLKVYLDGKIEQFKFDLSTKLRIDDMA